MNIYFSVENFAKIEKARINISNFTVFVGENNSGKTKLMELVYGVLRWLTNWSLKIDMESMSNPMEFRENEIEEIIKRINEALEENKKQIIQSIFNQSITLEHMSIEVEDIDCWYKALYITRENMKEFEENVHFTQEDMADFINDMSPHNRLYVMKYSHEDAILLEKRTIGLMKSIEYNRVRRIVIGEILQSIIGGRRFNDMLFLPASRMGLVTLYRDYFVAHVDEKISHIGETHKNEAQLTRPVMDFLLFLLKYSYTEANAEKNQEIISFINEKLIEGKLNEKGERTTYLPQNEEIEIPLFLSSSMINEIDPIIKMLTNFIDYNYLFYDEVETSLHPLKQVELVKLLNRLNNKGIRIIFSTHSETFANKLNNLLLISKLRQFEDKLVLCDGKIEIEKEDLLKSDNIHVYQFVNGSNGKSVVKELEFRTVPAIGYRFELFEDSAVALYEESKIALGVEM